MRLILPTLAVLAAFATPATAFDDSDRAEVLRAVDDFSAAFEARDWPAILPPDRVFDVLAEITDQDAGDIRAQTLVQIEETLAAVEIRSYSIAAGAMEPGEAPSGAQYALMPSTLVLAIGDEPAQAVDGLILAAELDEGWRLFRIESLQHWMLFLRAYPQFEGMAPPG